MRKAEEPLNTKIKLIGNIVHESVPVSNDEANNAILKTWGEPKKIRNKRYSRTRTSSLNSLHVGWL